MPELNLGETWKVEEVKFFDNQKDATTFVNEFNSHNKADIVPDWYMYATRPVRIV